MFKEYIKITDPEAFIDREKLPNPYPEQGFNACPVCKGYGRFNMRLNAYKLPKGKEDTPENRCTYVHFTGVCNHCNGWGYVDPGMICTGHKWRFEQKLGNCYNRYRCTVCGTTNDIDSGD